MNITIIGAGSMGYAFASLFLKNGRVTPDSLLIVEESKPRREFLKQRLQCAVEAGLEKIENPELVLIAVKPQDARRTCAALRERIGERTILLSILAGTPTASLSALLGGHKRIVRCMPNVPLQIGRGMLGYYAPAELDDKEKAEIEALLKTTGACLRLEREEDLDAITAISGCGPGYVYYVLNAFLEAARELGFQDEQASLLLGETFEGALRLWREDGSAPAELQKRVASKGGATQAAIDLFEERGVKEAITTGVKKAFARAVEMSGLSKLD